MPITQQGCSAAGCSSPAVYRTRVKPAYCLPHIDGIFRSGGLEPVGAFDKPTTMRRCRCLECGVEADYRMVTVEERAEASLTVCDACKWRAWAEGNRMVSGHPGRRTPNDLESVARHAREHLHIYLGPLTDPSLPDDPHLTECEQCGVRSVQRIGDMGFICGCTKSRTRTTPPGKKLFKDSGSPALDWWAEDNDPGLLATVTMKANREADWICPEGHRFSAPVRAMSESPRCDDCSELKLLADQARIQAIAHLTISQVPELAEAWDDPEYDPEEVMVLEDRPRFGVGFRWKCPNGHHPRMAISRWYNTGCSSCIGDRTRLANLAVVTLEPEIATQYAERNVALIEKVTPGSGRPRWWKDPVCGHEWEASPRERMQQPVWRCPTCRTRTNSFAWNYPTLAEEWADTNPVTPFHVLPTGRISFTPDWVCTETRHTVGPHHPPLESPAQDARNAEYQVSRGWKCSTWMLQRASSERLSPDGPSAMRHSSGEEARRWIFSSRRCHRVRRGVLARGQARRRHGQISRSSRSRAQGDTSARAATAAAADQRPAVLGVHGLCVCARSVRSNATDRRSPFEGRRLADSRSGRYKRIRGG